MGLASIASAEAALDKNRVIRTLNQALSDKYVFPEVGQQMAAAVRRKLKAGAYDSITDPTALAAALEADYRAVSRDGHLRISYNPNTVDFGEPTAEQVRRRHVALMQSNYGFTRLEILPGNVGFVDLRAFNDVREAGDTAVAAMNFLANTDAIIIDLRYNGGGSPSMVQLLTSYFLEDATHLNSFYVRESDSYQQFWSSSHVQGPKLLQQPLYLLIGNRTFSAAEEFAYNLKNLKRATLVGQVTGGGAHPVQYHYFEAINFGMTIPFGRAINPITHTNWEGTGIAPHIEVVSADALDVAHQKALENLLANTQNEILRHARTWALELLQSRRVPFEIARDELNDYVGDFGGRTIRLQRDALVYVRGTRQLKMIPLAKDAFRFNELDNLRLYFKRDSRGRVVGLTVKYNNGREIKAIKTS